MGEIKVRLLSDEEIWEERRREIANGLSMASKEKPENKDVYDLMQELLQNVKVKSLTKYYKEHKDG